MKKTSNRTSIRAMCECGVLIAAAQILGYLKLFRLPNGGSVTLNMLPIFLIGIRWGCGFGFLSGFVFGLLQLLLDGGVGFGWQSILGDYLVAYTVLGFAGLIRKDSLKACLGNMALGGMARLAVAVIVGATVWAEYMPPEFWGMAMNDPWIYSLLYNAGYILPATALCMAVAAILRASLRNWMRPVRK